ncbi:MAG TPA: hypothetical protein PKD28_03415 [Candidatus Saccharibacteria bacterium]|nr:hypothetical protein [Candidatus Saccharibacteria bacterium]
MKKLFAALVNAPKRTAAILMLAVAVVVPAFLWAWGPSDRPTYTYENPAPHVTFNSMTGTPNYGNELNFVRIKEASAPNNTYSDNVDLQPGKEYTVMVYFHNNAASHLNGAEYDYKGIALNTKMRVQMPATVRAGEQARITGFVSADNAQPGQVWDEAYGKASNNIALRYVADSATIYSNGAVDGQKLPDTLYTTGAYLGYDKLDGKLPGCNQYAGFVTFKIKVDQPNFEITKQVAKKGTTNWQDAISANPGEEVEYRIHYKNTGTTIQNNVVIKDVLPAGVTYVNGSTQVSNAASNFQWQPTTNNEVTRGGLNIGNYAAGGGAYVKFLAKLPASSALECGKTHKLVNSATAETNNGNKSDTADVTITTKDCPPKPAYTCDSLSVKKLERTKFEFSTKYTVTNATFKHVTYVVKNAAGTEVYRGQNNTFSTQTVGKYTVESFVTVTVNGTDKTVTSAACKGAFEVTEKPVEPKPGVDITKKVDGVDRKTVALNQEFAYQLTIKNTGNVDLTNVKVTDTAPAGVVFLSADKGQIIKADRGFEGTPDTWSYTIPTLKVGQSITATIKAKAIKTSLTGIVNTACVDAPQIAGTPDDCDDATIIVPPTPAPGISIDKKVDGVEHKKVAVNQAFTYQIVVRNTGNVDLKNVTVTDNAPAHVQFISADKGTIKDNKWSYVIPELKVGTSASFAIKAKVLTEVEGIIKNTACVDATEITGTPDDCDDATVEVPTTKPPVDTDMKVCDVETKTIITIKKSEFDENKHTEDLSKCAQTPTPEVPTELPTTGLSEGIMAFVGLGSLVASLGYYIASRRALGA